MLCLIRLISSTFFLDMTMYLFLVKLAFIWVVESCLFAASICSFGTGSLRSRSTSLSVRSFDLGLLSADWL